MRPSPILLTSFLLAASAAPLVPAQTGPWIDGEIVIRSQTPSAQSAIFRVDPETGASALLTIPQSFGGWSGSMAFDSHRGGLLCNVSLPPDGAFVYRLWLVSHDGSATAMPGFTGEVRALATSGDGRVFFVRHTGASQGLTILEYFDAQNGIRTLMQSDGVTPFQADVEHLLYDASSNALIGSSSAQWAATHCSATGSSFYRIPLSADGRRVEGSVTCASVSSTLLYGEIMSLDHLPNGGVLATTASAFLGAPHRFLALNPVTLAVASWAEPSQSDVNGGFWSARLGKAIVHANSGSAWWIPDGLHTFAPGENSYGAHIPTSLPLPVGGGFGPGEILIEVDANGPACDGFQVPYGTGLPGAGSIVPLLGVIGCPDVGSTFTLAIDAVRGGAPGLLLVSLTSGALPIFGGTLWLGPPALSLPISVGGTPGLAGAGSMSFPISFNDPSYFGVDFYLQAAFVDAAAVQGVSLTRGLRLQAG